MSPSACCIAGPIPPPRHGVSAINEAVAAIARGQGETLVLNTAPVSLDRALSVRLTRWKRAWAAMRALRSFGRRHPRATAYFSVSGGWGMLYEIFMVWAARRSGMRIMLHHHSFRYLDASFPPMRWVAALAGRDALHVTLCSGMEKALRARYSEVRHTLVVSNAAFMPPIRSGAIKPTGEKLVVGHLSNLSAAKGLWHVLALAEALQRIEAKVCFEIAGPCEDSQVEEKLRARLAVLTNVRYRGPVYGEAKESFFAELDVFAFPTQYRNEAEPLVLHEALANSCAVLAYDRGCISGLVDEDCGVLVDRAEDFTAAVLPTLVGWSENRESLASAQQAAGRKFEMLRASSAKSRSAFEAAFFSPEKNQLADA